jgi:hypothetical protein
VELHPDAVERVRRHFGVDQSLQALFGSYDDRPAAAGVVSRFRNLLHHHTHTSQPGPACTFWAGCGAVRRERFLIGSAISSDLTDAETDLLRARFAIVNAALRKLPVIGTLRSGPPTQPDAAKAIKDNNPDIGPIARHIGHRPQTLRRRP